MADTDAPKPPQELMEEIEKIEPGKLKRTSTRVEDTALVQAKIQAQIQKAQPNLKHTETKGEGLSDGVKQAYLDDKAGKPVEETA